MSIGERPRPPGFVNRRQILAAGAGALAAHSLPSLLSPVRAGTPGGRFRLGMVEGQTTDTLDPQVTNNTFLVHLNLQLRNCLVEIGPDFEALPELAETFEPLEGAKKWAFKIRKGVEFHNGKSLSADDVLYSINVHRAESSKSGGKALLKPVVDIAKDGNAIVFTLDSANADFPYVLADYHFVIVPEGATDFEKGIGTGGYTFQEFDPGVRSLVKRNPNYWKADRAHFDEVEMLNIVDPSARSSALLSGSVDAIVQADFKTVGRLQQVPDLQLVEVVGTQHITMPMLVDTAPFDNVDVRLAIKYAIDREHLVKTVLYGHGVAGNDHPIAPVNRYYAKDIPIRPYDPEKARFHLKKAGHERLSVQLHASDTILGLGIDTALLCQSTAAKAGIDIEVVREPADGYWDRVWLNKPWYEGFWAGRPTEDWMFTQVYAADASWNEAHWKNERFNVLLKEARGELDTAKRREMYREMQLLCSDDGGSVIPMFTNVVDAASRKVGFGKVAANLGGDGARCSERWWFV
ncbi:MAG: ABC transporter substrate-binding protein [Parvibaculaceae bacterium]